ncbi:acyl-CoA dehydrogenase family protein [Actinokineospora auranticolor]|uniref:Alkylation response protein AidB-like acyl-CoA dehydrogenase n=1 Tax=Actinokineospora auranticolor TaxID=155976 RepID=A0A2S6GII7_9PSEU|nr:acyl-CoA dehydrogenase family protein [Actinokineospora auranticolor]PPK65044.1 alkylation response protein AidB-like acyl-CoA dehydrogenase [Actinokineospora auranticolor]
MSAAVLTATGLEWLDCGRPPRSAVSRSAASAIDEVRAHLADGGLELPMPGEDTVARWAALARLGRTDLVVARLAEGHVDAVAILAESGRDAVAGAVYGVWASRSGGVCARLVGGRVCGTTRFCSGGAGLDRVLVVAVDEAGAARLVEIDPAHPGVTVDPSSWQAIGMDASASADVRFDHVEPTAVVGPPDWYAARPGFAVGGGGVAAVWLGGAVGVLDDVVDVLGGRADEHQLAHLGALHAAVAGAGAHLEHVARMVDAGVATGHHLATCRAVVERAAWEVLDRAPRVVGPTPLCRDRVFAQRLADLQVYVRQHHAERDLAALGRTVLDRAGRGAG